MKDIPRRTLVGFYGTPDYNPILDKLGTDFRFIHLRPPNSYISNPMVGDFKEFTMDPVELKRDFRRGRSDFKPEARIHGSIENS